MPRENDIGFYLIKQFCCFDVIAATKQVFVYVVNTKAISIGILVAAAEEFAALKGWEWYAAMAVWNCAQLPPENPQ